MSKLPLILIIIFIAAPKLVMAAPPKNFSDVVNIFLGLINPFLVLLLGLAFLVFFKGLVKFIYKAGEKDHKEGRDLMIWGAIALFIMVSVIGIIRFAYNDLGFKGTKPFGIPLLPTNAPTE